MPPTVSVRGDLYGLVRVRVGEGNLEPVCGQEGVKACFPENPGRMHYSNAFPPSIGLLAHLPARLQKAGTYSRRNPLSLNSVVVLVLFFTLVKYFCECICRFKMEACFNISAMTYHTGLFS